MPTIRRRATVPFSAEQMYALVDDIESYPQFLHWCRAARITRRDGATVEATLEIGLAGLHKQISTRNTCEPYERMTVALVAGPFKRLNGEWRFEPLSERGCNVTLTLTFEAQVSPFGLIFAAAFEEIARAQMRAFQSRAERLYGT